MNEPNALMDALDDAVKRMGEASRSGDLDPKPAKKTAFMESRIWLHIRGESNEFHGRLPSSRVLPMTALMLDFIYEAEYEKRLPEYEI